MDNSLEYIISQQNLDESFKNAVSWCRANLSKHLELFGFFDYGIFHYCIDNDIGFSDMCFDENDKGLIRVSTDKLKWYKQREGKLPFEPETDCESMFVHEITEFIILAKPEIFSCYFSRMEMPHAVARGIENINRREKGLKECRLY